MGNKDLLIAANTIWVVLAAILVMFMQAGFAFLEAGLTRMKNAAHIAGKNVLIFAVCSLVYYAVGFGIAFGDGNSFIGTSGFFPSSNELLAIGQAPYSFFTGIPAASGYLFEVVFAGVSLAIVWGAMAERAKLWVYPAFGVVFTLIYSVTSHWVWHVRRLAVRPGHAGLRRLDGRALPGRPRRARRCAPARAADREVRPRRTCEPDPGPQHAVRRPRDDHPLVRLVRLQPRLDARSRHRRSHRLLRLRRADDEHRRRGRRVGGLASAWWILRKPDISMMLNGVLAALVAITAASGFVAPWAAIVIGAVSGWIAVAGVLFVERIGIDDPIGAVAVHGMSGVWGTLATGIFAVPALASNLATGKGGLVYTGSFHQLGVQALGLVTVGAFTFSTCFGSLWVMKRVWGIRVEPETETAGLDVSEHGMWGYPEFYIPVPGGYGTETHGHLGLSHGNGHAAPAPAVPAAQPEPAPAPG